jgi:hypothetical protein
MCALFAEGVIENNKKRVRHLVASDSAKIDNLLYKSIPILAVSHRGETSRCLFIAFDCSPLRSRPGTGKQAARSPAEAGHDSGEPGTEQKIRR